MTKQTNPAIINLTRQLASLKLTIARTIPGTKQYWQAVEDYRALEQAQKDIADVFGQSFNQ